MTQVTHLMAASAAAVSDDDELRNQIYNTHRVSAQNADYFAWKAGRYEKYCKAAETVTDICVILATAILLATAAEGAEGSGQKWLTHIAEGLSTIAVIAIAFKLTMGWRGKYEEFREQWRDYHHLHRALDDLVHDIRRQRRFIEGHHGSKWEWIRETFSRVSKADPPDAVAPVSWKKLHSLYARATGSEGYVSERRKFDAIQEDVKRRFPNHYYDPNA